MAEGRLARRPAGVARLLRECSSAEEMLACLTGRPVSARLENCLWLVWPGPSPLLRAQGPVLGRDVELVAWTGRYQVGVSCLELVVAARLPTAVAAALVDRDAPLSRLLASAGMSWRSEQVGLAAGDRWPRRRARRPAQLVRRIWCGSEEPCALVCEQVRIRPTRDGGAPAAAAARGP